MNGRKLLFCAPDPDGFVSGGNIYNRALVKALSSLGFQIEWWVEGQADPEGADWVIFDTLMDLRAKSWMARIPAERCILLWHSGGEARLRHLAGGGRDRPALICTGTWVADLARSAGWPEEEILVLEPGLPEGRIPEWSPPPAPPVRLLIVANLLPEKGLLEFFSCWTPQVGQDRPTVHMDVYGGEQLDPGYARELHRLWERQPWKAILRWKGLVSQDQLWDEMASGHALVSVSPEESFGMAIREARLVGLPVLTCTGGEVARRWKGCRNVRWFDTLEDLIQGLESWIEAGTPPMTQPGWPSDHRSVIGPPWTAQAAKFALWLQGLETARRT